MLEVCGSGGSAHGAIRAPPDGCFSIAVTPGEPTATVVLVGPHLGPIEVTIGPDYCVRGVRLRPEAAGCVISSSLNHWVGQIEPVSRAVPELDALLVPQPFVGVTFDTLLDTLQDLVSHLPAPAELIRRAVSAIEIAKGDIRIGDLARSLGVSQRTLQRKFLSATGLPPKTYARIRRFLLAAAEYVLREEPEAWGRIAVEHGFADHAHFARECLDLTGVSPTTFAAWMREIEHVDVQP